MKPTGHSLARKINRGWEAAERIILTLLAAGMVALALAQIVLRNAFKTGLVWAEPVLGMMLLWLTMFGALAATGSRRHININLAEHLFPPRFAPWFLLATNVFAALVCGLLSLAGFRFCRMQAELDPTLLLGIPAWIYLLVIPVCFGLMALRFAAQSVGGWVLQRRDRRTASAAELGVSPLPGSGP